MTKIKLCGLTSKRDVEAVNRLLPEYIGFVFAARSKRYITKDTAAILKKNLHPSIAAVGVFVGEKEEHVARLLNKGIIDLAQLHGGEDEAYIKRLRLMTDKPLIKAFTIESRKDLTVAQESTAAFGLLDSGLGGTGTTFDWSLLRHMSRPYFLAGGLHADNIQMALNRLNPYAVDVSSGIETSGHKDYEKMTRFVETVRMTAKRKEEIL